MRRRRSLRYDARLEFALRVLGTELESRQHLSRSAFGPRTWSCWMFARSSSRPSHPAFLRDRISSDLSTSQQVDANRLAAQANELAVMGEESKEAECFTGCFASSCRSSIFTRKMPLLLAAHPSGVMWLAPHYDGATARPVCE